MSFEQYLARLGLKISDQLMWMGQLALTMLLTLLVAMLVWWLIRVFMRREAHPTARQLIGKAITPPIMLFIMLSGGGIALDILQDEYARHKFLKTIADLWPSFFVLAVCWLVLRLIGHMAKHTAATTKPDTPFYLNANNLDMLQKLGTVLVVVAGVLVTLPTLGVSISGLLTIGGLGGIIAGLAAKDLLANYFGALMLHWDRPFAIGEWINLPEKNIEGIVEQIGWRQVAIRTFEKRLVFVPNAAFSTLLIENPSRMTHRRINETIGLRYDDLSKVGVILAAIKEYLQNHENVDASQPTIVALKGLGTYSVDIMVSCYTRITVWPDFLAFRQEVLLTIEDILQQHGAEVAFPTQVMQLQGQAAPSTLLANAPPVGR